MLLKSAVGYFKGRSSLEGHPLPEVKKALIDDAPRIVRLTIWAVIAFFVFLVGWAHFAVIDEVTKGEGKAIPSGKVQKIQNLEGGIVADIYVKEGQIVEAGAPLLRLDDTRFVSNVGETEADRVAMELRVERLSAEVDGRPLNITDDARKSVPKQAGNEESLYMSRKQQLSDELSGLQQQMVQRQQELREFTAKQGQYLAFIWADLPPNSHPVAIRACPVDTPSGADGATGDRRSWSGLRSRSPVAVRRAACAAGVR